MSDIKALYRKFRNAGYRSRYALSAARTYSRWDRINSLSDYDEGIVRIRCEHETECPHWVYGNPEPYTDQFGRYWDSQSQIERDNKLIDSLGNWWIVSEFKDENGEWQEADSIGMCYGYENPDSPFENSYVIDLMASAIVESDKVAVRELQYA